MNPRARMMLQQRAQLQPGGMPMQSGDNPGANQQGSPLLAQQLSGRPLPPQGQPNQPPNPSQQQPPQPQQQPQQPQSGGEQDELEGLDNVNELGDLGMGEEDILGMSENFDILEFADALDDLDKLPDNDKEGQGPSTQSQSQPANAGAVQAPNAGQRGPGAPPPPPYPGPQSQTPTSKVSLYFVNFLLEQPSALKFELF